MRQSSVSSSDWVIEAVDPEGPAAGWCLEQYYQELQTRFVEGFDPTKSAIADPQVFRRPKGTFLVARIGDRWVGCGALMLTAKDVAYIKRMWVDPSCRGCGLGRGLLDALEGAAAKLGCDVVQLETHRSLEGARRLYLSSGYREVERFNDEYYAHHWFEKEIAPGEGRPPRG